MFLSSIFSLMHHIGKAVKYILWIVFSCIVLMLLIGWAKMDWNMSSYVGFLNMSNWSNFDIAQPSTWSAPFWASSDYSGSIAESMSGAVSTSVSSGLDVYDPSFEEDFGPFTTGFALSDNGSGETTPVKAI